jgi:hypothetical protein
LGNLDDEMSRQCRVAEIRLKGVKAERAGLVEEACKALEECQGNVREARQGLLEYEGFLHAQRTAIREALDHPRLGGKAAAFFGQVGDRLGPALDGYVSNMVGEGMKILTGLEGALRALAEAEANQMGDGASTKDSLKSLKNTLSTAEKAIEKAVKMTATSPSETPGGSVEMEAEIEEERIASHGYQLTAKGLPPEFLENAQKKKDEAAAKAEKDNDESEKKASDHGYQLTAKVPDFIQKKIDERENGEKDEEDDDDEKKGAKKASHGYALTAASRTPGNESKGPVEEGEEDEGWVPGHLTGEKKKAYGYSLTA